MVIAVAVLAPHVGGLGDDAPRNVCPAGDISCSKTKRKRKRAEKQVWLQPDYLPTPETFSDWDSDSEIHFHYSNSSQRLLSGRIRQVGHAAFFSHFSVVPELVTREEVTNILDLMKGKDGEGDNKFVLDNDMDTVDGMPTREFFLDSDAVRSGLPSKGTQAPGTPEQQKYRKVLRRKLRQITQKILDERIIPFVRHRYPHCTGRDGIQEDVQGEQNLEDKDHVNDNSDEELSAAEKILVKREPARFAAVYVTSETNKIF
jgi:hypothetical protein